MHNASRRRCPQRSFRPLVESLEPRLTPTTYTVSSLADFGDGSLRAAMTSVNGDPAGSPDEIDFSIAGVIKLTSGALPAITNTVKIDGTTGPGFATAPVVEIDNNGFAGLTFNGASNSTLASLSIVNANGAGVTLNGTLSGGLEPGTGFNITVVGNYIGLALDGSVAANTGYGLFANNSTSDTIGGTAALERNVISGNGAGGIQIVIGTGEGFGEEGASILGNFIGTDPTGTAAAGNQGNGITLLSILGGNTVGGTTPGAGNIIAFNSQSGVAIESGTGILSNSIFSNGSMGINFPNSDLTFPAPQLNYAIESPGSLPDSVQVKVGGILNMGPALAFPTTIQVFATLNGIPAGQGQLFLGSVQVTPNANGFSKFTLNALVPAGSGVTFTATATLANATTSFSAPIAIGGNTNNLFVASAYGLLLNRSPDTSAAYWVNLLNNGGSAASVVLGIEGSIEYLNDQVVVLYKRYLQRTPDTGGEQAWTNFLVAGGTFEQMAEALVSSQEYYVLQGGTNQGFLTALYRDVLQRGPSIGELAGWETALDAGVSRASVAIAFLTSQEYRSNLVQSDYVTYLLRTVDSGGLAAWVNALNAGATDQQVLAQIFGSAEGYQLWS